MTELGWDSAEFRCGRCGHSFIATTEADYVIGQRSHQAAHSLLDAASSDLRDHLKAIAAREP